MEKGLLSLSSCVLCALLFVLPHSSTPPTTGTYSYTLVADSSDDVKRAVNHTVEHMGFFTRPIARRRLTRLNPIPHRVQVAITPDTLSVAFDSLNPIVTPLDGTDVRWRSAITKDEEYTVHAAQQADTVSQVFSAPDGERRNAFRFDDDCARLSLRVTITSRRLPRPLEYTLLFRRDSP